MASPRTVESNVTAQFSSISALRYETRRLLPERVAALTERTLRLELLHGPVEQFAMRVDHHSEPKLTSTSERGNQRVVA